MVGLGIKFANLGYLGFNYGERNVFSGGNADLVLLNIRRIL